MRSVSFLLVLAIAVCPGSASDVQAKGNTMGKVISLLNGMMDKSKEDGAKDQEIFAKFKCYCGKMDAEKTASIAELSTQIESLDGEIENLAAVSKKLSTEVAMLDKQMIENEQARTSAESLREKASSDFISEEEDMNQAMGSMTTAIETLEGISYDEGGAASASLASTSSKMAKKLRGSDNTPLPAAKHALKEASIFLPENEKKALLGFIQSGMSADKKSPIVGILKQMKDTFETNLKNAQAGEAAAVEAHTNYIDTAQNSYDTMQSSMEAKQDLLGSNDGDLGTAKTSYDTAQTNQAEEQEFVASLNTMCADKSKEYEERKMMRANEDAAVAKAISILNSDSAFEVFGKTSATSTGATGFIQISSKRKRVRGAASLAARRKAQQALSRAAKAKGASGFRLRKLASMLETNPFDIVVKQIEKQMSLIDKEEQADDDQKVWCDGERENNDALVEDKKSNIDRLEGELDQTISDIEEPGDGLQAVLAEAQQNLKDTRDSMATLTADRQAGNGEYRNNVANLAEAEETIEKALKVLVDYYDWLHRKQAPHSYAEKSGKGSPGGGIKRLAGGSVDELEEACSADPNCAGFSTDGWLKSELAPEEDWYDASDGTSLYVKEYEGTSSVTGNLLQLRKSKKEDPEPPSTWEDESAESGGGYAGQTGAGGDAVSMLRFILDETKAEEKTAHETEEKGQADYEDEMSRLTEEENTFLETVADTESELANKEKQRAETSMNLDETKKDLASIEHYLADIKHNCDFINENMDVRKEARRAEKSALKEAVNGLTGTPEYEAAVEEAKEAEEAKEKAKTAGSSGTF